MLMMKLIVCLALLQGDLTPRVLHSCSPVLYLLLSPPTQHKYEVTVHLVRLQHLKILALDEMTHLARFLTTGDPPRLHALCYAISLFLAMQLPNIN